MNVITYIGTAPAQVGTRSNGSVGKTTYVGAQRNSKEDGNIEREVLAVDEVRIETLHRNSATNTNT